MRGKSSTDSGSRPFLSMKSARGAGAGRVGSEASRGVAYAVGSSTAAVDRSGERQGAVTTAGGDDAREREGEKEQEEEEEGEEEYGSAPFKVSDTFGCIMILIVAAGETCCVSYSF